MYRHFHEILALGTERILDRVPWLIVATSVALAALAVERFVIPRVSRPTRVAIHVTTIVGALVVSVLLAWRVLWLCDDAYITFRYARSFADGRGLVFNPGEWVEGYTNFLWTFFLGALGWVGFDIPRSALFVDLGAMLAVLLIVAGIVRATAPRPPAIAFASLALAGSAGFTTFGSSGLETMPATALVVAGMWATARRGALLAGFLFTLATMCRPDHVLFYGCMGIALVASDLWRGDARPIRRRFELRRYAAYGAPFVLLYLPYFLLRWRAYGDFFPNPYYAKSGDGAYWEQGFAYLAYSLVTAGAWAWIPAAALALLGTPRSRDDARFRIFALLSALLYGGYIVRVGGDFMEHRFFIALLPIIAVTVEVAARWRFHDTVSPLREGLRMTILAPALAVGFAAATVPVRLLEPFEKRWHLAAEHTFYRVKSIWPIEVDSHYFSLGKELHRSFTARGIEPRFAFDCVGMVGYYSELPIVDTYGLVSRRIAHRPISMRGRPGHEKHADLEDVLAEGAIIDPLNRWPEWRDETRIVVDGRELWLLQRDPTVDAIAKIDGATVPDTAADVRLAADDSDRSRRLAALAFFTRFLAPHPRREEWLAPLVESLSAVADFETGMPPGAELEGAIRIDAGEPPRGASGRGWLSSAGGNGSVRIPLRIAANELRFALGGAEDPGLRVELEVDGAVVRFASPAGGRDLAPISWEVRLWRDRTAVLVIRDDARSAGLRVDAIHWPRPRGDVRDALTSVAGFSHDQLFQIIRATEEELPEGDPARDSTSKRIAFRLTFDGDSFPAEAKVTGNAFGRAPLTGRLPFQSRVHGRQGRGYLNSYHGTDTTTGRVEVELPNVRDAAVGILIGGGGNCRSVHAELRVGDEVVARACGRRDEVLRQVVLRTGPTAGKPVRLVLVDDGTEAWDHLLVDDVMVADVATPQRITR